MSANKLYDAAKHLVPSLRFAPTDPSLYTSFSVVYHPTGIVCFFSHYRIGSLLLTRATPDEDGTWHIETGYKRHVDDLFFLGFEDFGELFMHPDPQSFAFEYYREGIRKFLRALDAAARFETQRIPEEFCAVHGQNNGRVIIRLTTALRHRIAVPTAGTYPTLYPF